MQQRSGGNGPGWLRTLLGGMLLLVLPTVALAEDVGLAAATPAGGRGLYRTQTAQPAEAELAWAAAYGTFSYDPHLLGADNGALALGESLAVGVSPWPALELSLAVLGRHTAHLTDTTGDLGGFADFALHLKYAYELRPWLALAAVAGGRMKAGVDGIDPVRGQPTVYSRYGDVLSPELQLAATVDGAALDGAPPLRAHLNLGFAWDNSCKLIAYLGNPCSPNFTTPGVDPTPFERFAWQLRDSRSLLASLGVEAVRPRATAFADLAVRWPMRRSADIKSAVDATEVPLFVALGARAPLPPPGLAATVVADLVPNARSTRRPGTGRPAEPPWTLVLGLQYTLARDRGAPAPPPPVDPPPPPAPPAPATAVIAGTVVDSATREPVAAYVAVPGPVDAPVPASPATGAFRLVVPPGTYTLQITSATHRPYQQLVTADSAAPVEIAYAAEPFKAIRFGRDQIEIRRNVEFEFGKAVLQPASFELLDEIAGVLAEIDTIRLIVEGHTDSIGSADANKALSQDRAEAVRSYLVEQGLAAERLQAIGYGADRPIAGNDSEAGRAQNRRVGFRIVSAEESMEGEQP